MSVDLNIFYSFYNLASTNVFWHWLAVFCATYLIWFLFAWFLIAFVWHKRAGLKEFLIFAIGGGLIYILSYIIELFWFRLRPFAAEHLIPLIEKSVTSKSFPSDHTAAAFFVVTLLVAHRKSWWWALVLASLVGLSRIAVGVHYPSDVLVGAGLGVTLAVVALKVEKILITKK